MPIIYHVTTQKAWEKALQKKQYVAASLADEGFIHCSQAAQVPGVLQRYYAGKTNLVLLTIQTDLLESPFVFEWSPSTADTYPHIYGPINTNAVITVTDISATPSATV